MENYTPHISHPTKHSFCVLWNSQKETELWIWMWNPKDIRMHLLNIEDVKVFAAVIFVASARSYGDWSQWVLSQYC